MYFAAYMKVSHLKPAVKLDASPDHRTIYSLEYNPKRYAHVANVNLNSAQFEKHRKFSLKHRKREL